MFLQMMEQNADDENYYSNQAALVSFLYSSLYRNIINIPYFL